jgi:hypothetical protein
MGNISDDWPEIYAIRCNSNGVLAAYAPPSEPGAPPWEVELELPAYLRTERRDVAIERLEPPVPYVVMVAT